MWPPWEFQPCLLPLCRCLFSLTRFLRGSRDRSRTRALLVAKQSPWPPKINKEWLTRLSLEPGQPPAHSAGWWAHRQASVARPPWGESLHHSQPGSLEPRGGPSLEQMPKENVPRLVPRGRGQSHCPLDPQRLRQPLSPSETQRRC